jgi:hypothetical protein
MLEDLETGYKTLAVKCILTMLICCVMERKSLHSTSSDVESLKSGHVLVSAQTSRPVHTAADRDAVLIQISRCLCPNK